MVNGPTTDQRLAALAVELDGLTEIINRENAMEDVCEALARIDLAPTDADDNGTVARGS